LYVQSRNWQIASRRAGFDKSIRCGTHDADVKDNHHPEHDAERQLLCLMAKLSLADQRAGPSSQERHQVQGALGHSATGIGRSPLIQPVGKEANKTHHGNDDQVSCGGNFHVLWFFFANPAALPDNKRASHPRPILELFAVLEAAAEPTFAGETIERPACFYLGREYDLA